MMRTKIYSISQPKNNLFAFSMWKMHRAPKRAFVVKTAHPTNGDIEQKYYNRHKYKQFMHNINCINVTT